MRSGRVRVFLKTAALPAIATRQQGLAMGGSTLLGAPPSSFLRFIRATRAIRTGRNLYRTHGAGSDSTGPLKGRRRSPNIVDVQ